VRPVFCPQCGKRNEEGASYCSACGRRLPEPDFNGPRPVERSPLRQLAGRLIGRSARERRITAATVVALAIAALVALGANELFGGDDAQDAYQEEADRVCVERKQALALLSEEVLGSRKELTLARYGNAGAEVVAGWRSQLGSRDAPAGLQEPEVDLDRALAKVEDELRAVASRPREGGEALRRLGDRLTTPVSRAERAIEALGLDGCADVPLALGAAAGG
jgi:hypothetical protein